jgi:hypothetical protein
MSNPKQHIPFNNVQELVFHIDMSNLLVEKVKNRIEQLPILQEEDREKVENYITESLTVLIDGYTNMILSIQQSYIKNN